ncbi:hypothetical protein [Alkaliflexus imshenetskii]|uniref:hypothetical protein n=1 Tax=Alkaliflexus imshenetskii TaxID=286730 RepID=UPI0006936A40|nr:hypothetical protein [Alkaliflexus imshenetskii]
MKKRLPIACICAILFLATYNMAFEVKAQKRSQTSGPDWKNWSDERITQWEDSVINAQYPAPEIEQYTTTYAIPKTEVPEISQPLPTPQLKSSTTATLSTNIDKSKAFGEIPVIPGHGLNGAATLQVPIQI